MLPTLACESKSSRPALPPPSTPSCVPRKVEIPAGIATLGMRRSENGTFGWDNEFEEHRVEVPAFAIDAYNVTNQEYRRFVLEGGYRDGSMWSEAGWERISSEGREHPIFWVRRGDSWACRTMFEEIPLPLDWPVYVSHDEASAYARWAGKELPREAEWHRAACATRDAPERAYPWGAELPSPRHRNFDLQRWDPTP